MRLSRRLVVRAVLFLGTLALSVPAAAAIDATGRWVVFWDSFIVSEVVVEDMTQAGSSLTSSSGFSGTIDSTSGAFSQGRPAGICQFDSRAGTFAADGETFTATGMLHRFDTPTLCFVGTPVVFTGSRCGSGIVTDPEECDDGNLVDGDGCSASCRVEPCYQCTGEPSLCTPLPAGTACDDGDPCTATSECTAAATCVGTAPVDCDDGVPCTQDECAPSFGNSYVCVHGTAYRNDCRTAGASSLLVIDDGDDRDRLTWKWSKGASTSLAEFADPRSTAGYELCLYGPDTSVVAGALVPPNAQTWSASGQTGFRYRDRTGSQTGAQSVSVRSSTVDRSKITWKGKGANLPDLVPPLDLPVTVQLRNTATNVCWGATYSAATSNQTGKLKARTP